MIYKLVLYFLENVAMHLLSFELHDILVARYGWEVLHCGC